MDRRTFLGTGVSLSVGGVNVPLKPSNKPLRRIFRKQQDGYQEIAFEQIEPGERVLVLELHEGRLTMLDEWHVMKHAVLLAGEPCVYLHSRRELLPQTTPSDERK